MPRAAVKMIARMKIVWHVSQLLDLGAPEYETMEKKLNRVKLMLNCVKETAHIVVTTFYQF